MNRSNRRSNEKSELALAVASTLCSMSSAFNPQAFLDVTFNQASSTIRVPIDAGTHMSVIEDVKIRSGNKDGKDWAFLDVTYGIDSPELKTKLGRDKIQLTQGVSLDFTPDGGLDFQKGRNVMLGRLRDSTGLNEEGKPFGFRMLIGKPVKIVVTHTPSTRPGAQPGDVFENVSAFVKA